MPLTQVAWPQAMRNPVRGYDWGSVTVLAQMSGRQPTGEPEAELWVGAHPDSPSELITETGEVARLDEVIAADPQHWVGQECFERFGPRLPFLTKILAIEKSLSVQVHPTAQQAQAGFAAQREDGAEEGQAVYTDPFPKPEMLYALTPTVVLAGMRPAGEAVAGLRALASLAPSPRQAQLLLQAAGLIQTSVADVMVGLASWKPYLRENLADAAAAAAASAAPAASATPSASASSPSAALAWVQRLAAEHPGDPWCLAPLLLRLLELPPGGTLFLPAGVPHAYLSGCGVEVMAPSDNVVRAGLTTKRIDPQALAALVDPAAGPLVGVPAQQLGQRQTRWQLPTEFFAISRAELEGDDLVLPAEPGPRTLLCTRGEITVRAQRELQVRAGASVYLGPGAGEVVLGGTGEVFCTSMGLAAAS